MQGILSMGKFMVLASALTSIILTYYIPDLPSHTIAEGNKQTNKKTSCKHCSWLRFFSSVAGMTHDDHELSSFSLLQAEVTHIVLYTLLSLLSE